MVHTSSIPMATTSRRVCANRLLGGDVHAEGLLDPHLDVGNPGGFQAYRDAADAAHEHYGKSKLLARGGRNERPEGKLRGRNVLRQFDSFDEARAFYDGPDYSRARPLRAPHSECDFLIVEGYDGAQP